MLSEKFMRVNMSVKIDTKSLDNFAEKLEKMSNNLSQKVCEESLNTLSAEVIKRAIKQSPRDTGKLARSWKSKPGVEKVGKAYQKTIYNSTDYSVYVEYGHRTRDHKSWIPGQFMLTRAIEDVDKMKTEIVLDVINKHFGDLFS